MKYSYATKNACPVFLLPQMCIGDIDRSGIPPTQDKDRGSNMQLLIKTI